MIKNIACGAAGLILAASYYQLADALPRSLLDDPTGASGLPKLLAVALGVLSLALIGEAWIRRPARGQDRGLHAHFRAAGMLGLGVLYVLLLPWLGYFGALCVLLIGVAVYSGARFWPLPIAVGLLGAAALWAIFVRLFGIAMPPGAWLG